MKWHFQHVPASTLSVLVAPTVQPDLVHVVSACEANLGPADISRQLLEQTLKRTGTLFSGFVSGISRARRTMAGTTVRVRHVVIECY